MKVRTVGLVAAVALCLAGLMLNGCGATPNGRDGAPIDVVAGPEQKEPASAPEPIRFSRGGYDWALTPKADYVLRGVVVSRKNYGSGWNSVLAPVDVAAAWGELVKSGLHKKLTWRQSNRWYYWRYGDDFLKNNDYVIEFSSNTHLIPATLNLRKALGAIRVGRSVEMNGMLVRVDGKKEDESRWWESSLSRTDQGDGSCEVLYVMRIKTGGKVYE